MAPAAYAFRQSATECVPGPGAVGKRGKRSARSRQQRPVQPTVRLHDLLAARRLLLAQAGLEVVLEATGEGVVVIEEADMVVRATLAAAAGGGAMGAMAGARLV